MSNHKKTQVTIQLTKNVTKLTTQTGLRAGRTQITPLAQDALRAQITPL